MKARTKSVIRKFMILVFLPALLGCKSSSKGWHRAAKPGERVGQVTSVQGASIKIVIGEPCLVHPGDFLLLKRLYCKDALGRSDTRDCKLYESGTAVVTSVQAADHEVEARMREGSATVDSPVFMGGEVLTDHIVP